MGLQKTVSDKRYKAQHIIMTSILLMIICFFVFQWLDRADLEFQVLYYLTEFLLGIARRLLGGGVTNRLLQRIEKLLMRGLHEDYFDYFRGRKYFVETFEKLIQGALDEEWWYQYHLKQKEQKGQKEKEQVMDSLDEDWWYQY